MSITKSCGEVPGLHPCTKWSEPGPNTIRSSTPMFSANVELRPSGLLEVVERLIWRLDTSVPKPFRHSPSSLKTISPTHPPWGVISKNCEASYTCCQRTDVAPLTNGAVSPLVPSIEARLLGTTIPNTDWA